MSSRRTNKKQQSIADDSSDWSSLWAIAVEGEMKMQWCVMVFLKEDAKKRLG